METIEIVDKKENRYLLLGYYCCLASCCILFFLYLHTSKRLDETQTQIHRLEESNKSLLDQINDNQQEFSEQTAALKEQLKALQQQWIQQEKTTWL
jgi:septal ring factor EnvC (AmiA/AmiB activator)